MPSAKPLRPDAASAAALARVLTRTREDLDAKRAERELLNARRAARGLAPRAPVKASLTFAISFAKHVGVEIATALVDLDSSFKGVRSGETPSESVRGPKRVDLNFSTPERGLGLAMSFKSVHFGEKGGGDSDFIHNRKRNDEELRVEATDHHLRQPYSVMVAVVFLPFQACEDTPTSSFGGWVEYLWPLKGRTEPEDPPDRFELVFVALYARDGREFGFYEVGGSVACPRHGRPRQLLSLRQFLQRVKDVYDRRNGRDFFFQGEQPPG